MTIFSLVSKKQKLTSLAIDASLIVLNILIILFVPIDLIYIILFGVLSLALMFFNTWIMFTSKLYISKEENTLTIRMLGKKTIALSDINTTEIIIGDYKQNSYFSIVLYDDKNQILYNIKTFYGKNDKNMVEKIVQSFK